MKMPRKYALQKTPRQTPSIIKRMADTPQNDTNDQWKPPSGANSGKWEDAPPAGGPAAPVEVAAPTAQKPLGSLLKPAISGIKGPFDALWSDPRGRPLILFSILGVIVVCGLSCFILSLALLTNNQNPGPIATPAGVVPTSVITQTNPIKINETPLPAAAPTRLTIKNSIFNITPLKLERGQWTYDRNAQKTAFWASGTLVNYVLGIHASNENKAVFDALNVGDLIVLDTSVGPQRYRVSEKQRIKNDDEEPFRNQVSPQITLVLLGESGDQRRIVIAKYTDEGTPNTLVSSGVPVNLGDTQVKVISSRIVPGPQAGLTGDKNYYQVNFLVTNLTTHTLNADGFSATLIDAAGAKYALSAQGSLAGGATGWVNGTMSPGQTITSTAGFEVPATIPGGKLEWNFAEEANSPYLARVSLAYRQVVVAPTAAPTSAPTAEVTILNASLSPEGTEVRIVGTVRNLTSNFLNVAQKDTSLMSGSTANLLNSALPAMPWSIQPNETLAFQLSYSRPPGGQAVIFTLLGKTFEIGGL